MLIVMIPGAIASIIRFQNSGIYLNQIGARPGILESGLVGVHLDSLVKPPLTPGVPLTHRFKRDLGIPNTREDDYVLNVCLMNLDKELYKIVDMNKHSLIKHFKWYLPDVYDSTTLEGDYAIYAQLEKHLRAAEAAVASFYKEFLLLLKSSYNKYMQGGNKSIFSTPLSFIYFVNGGQHLDRLINELNLATAKIMKDIARYTTLGKLAIAEPDKYNKQIYKAIQSIYMVPFARVYGGFIHDIAGERQRFAFNIIKNKYGEYGIRMFQIQNGIKF